MNQLTDTLTHAASGNGLLFALLGPLHKGYLRTMTGFAQFQSPTPSLPVSPEFAALDGAANQAGAIYRGLGVGIGLLSVMILALALMPVALGLSDQVAIVVIKIVKVALMVTVALAVAMAVFGPWRKRWTGLRKKAQALTWEHTAVANRRETNRERGADGDAALRRLVDEQIGYNVVTADKYRHVEHSTMMVTYLFFFVALVCAALDAFSYLRTGSSPKWLLIGTVFLPGVVGILHGVNGFLCVGEQAFSCRLMGNHLVQLRTELDRLKQPGAMAQQDDALADLRKEIVDALARHDGLWAESVKVPCP